jgi:hypothetical protein
LLTSCHCHVTYTGKWVIFSWCHISCLLIDSSCLLRTPTLITGTAYPEILGRLDDSGRELLRPAYSQANDLFVNLTAYLKKNQVPGVKLWF